MSMFYMATKLMRFDEEPGDLGAFAQELQGWRNLHGSIALFFLAFYRMQLVFFRKDLGALSTNAITLIVAAVLYGGFFLIGLLSLHLPLMMLAFASWLLHFVLSLSNIRKLVEPEVPTPPAYSFGEPRAVFLLFFGRYFPRWHYCLLYEPAVVGFPLLLSFLLYFPISLFEMPLPSPLPLMFFLGFHFVVLTGTAWWLFCEQCEIEVEMQTRRLEEETIRGRYDQAYDEQRGSHARARRN